MPRPIQGDFIAYQESYINCTRGNNIHEIIANHSANIDDFINALPEAKAEYKYAPEKWTVKDVLQHIIDAERIFVYRALTFARKDKSALPGFEENDYAANANTLLRSLQSLKDEFIATRKSTDIFLASLTDDETKQSGMANNNLITVNAIAFVILGHALHHINILQERYL